MDGWMDGWIVCVREGGGGWCEGVRVWNKCVYHREGKEGRRKCVHIFKSIIYVLYIYYNRLSEVPAPTSDPMPTRTPRAAAACRAGRVGGRAHLLHHAIAPRIYCIIYCTRLLHHATGPWAVRDEAGDTVQPARCACGAQGGARAASAAWGRWGARAVRQPPRVRKRG